MTTPNKRSQRGSSSSLHTTSRSQKKNAKEPIMGYTWAPIPVLSSSAGKRVEGDNTQPMGFVLGPVEKKTTKKPVQRKSQDVTTITGERKIIKLSSICDLNATQLEQFEAMRLMMETVLSNFSIEKLQELVFCGGSAQEFPQNGEYMAKLEAIAQVENYHITRAYIEDGLLCLVIFHDVAEPKSVERLQHTIIPDFNESASQDSGTEATSSSPAVDFESPISIDPISENGSEEKTLQYGFTSLASDQQPGSVSSSVLDGLSGTNSLPLSTHSEPEMGNRTVKSYKSLNRFWWSPDGPNRTINQPGALSGLWLRNKNVSRIPVYKSLEKNKSVFSRPLPQIPEVLPKANKGKGVATQSGRRVASEKSTGTVVRKSPIIGFKPKRRADVGVATEAQLDNFWGLNHSNRGVVSHVGGRRIGLSTIRKIKNPEPAMDTSVPPATPTSNSGRPNPRIFLTGLNESNRSVTWESAERPIQTSEKLTPGRINETGRQITSPSAPGVVTRKSSMDVIRPLDQASVGMLIYNPNKFTSLAGLRRRSSTQSLPTTRSRTFVASSSLLEKVIEKPTGIPSPVGGGSYRQHQTRSQKLWSDLLAVKTNVDEDEAGAGVNTPEASPEPHPEYIDTPSLCQSTRRGALVSGPEWS